jgi:hypothetical protein
MMTNLHGRFADRASRRTRFHVARVAFCLALCAGVVSPAYEGRPPSQPRSRPVYSLQESAKQKPAPKRPPIGSTPGGPRKTGTSIEPQPADVAKKDSSLPKQISGTVSALTARSIRIKSTNGEEMTLVIDNYTRFAGLEIGTKSTDPASVLGTSIADAVRVGAHASADYNQEGHAVRLRITAPSKLQ